MLPSPGRWLLATLLLSACMTEPASPQVDAEVTRLPAGRHARTQLGPAGDTIRYTVYVPGGVAPAAGHPLVVAAHFGGEVTPWLGGAFADLLVVPALADVPAVIVAPDARSWSGWSAAAPRGSVPGAGAPSGAPSGSSGN